MRIMDRWAVATPHLPPAAGGGGLLAWRNTRKQSTQHTASPLYLAVSTIEVLSDKLFWVHYLCKVAALLYFRYW
jgi:hypothetical protein